MSEPQPSSIRAGLPSGSASGPEAVPAVAGDAPSARWPVLVLVGLALVFVLRVLTGPATGASLHVDEAQYWDWSRGLQWGYFSKPPAVAALIATSTALFGDSETGVRLLAQACYALTCGVLALLARDLDARALSARAETGAIASATTPATAAAAPARHTGLWAAALFAASPLAGLLGLVATTDALLLLCWALALWALWRGVRRPGAWPWAGFALALGVGLLDKYTMAALIPGAALFTWRCGDRRAAAGLALAVLGALCLFAPHLVWNALAGWPTLRHTAEITVGTRGHGGAEAFSHAAAFIAAQFLLIAPFLLPWLTWRSWQQNRPAGPGLTTTTTTTAHAKARAHARARANARPAAQLQSAREPAALLVLTALPLALAGLWQAAGGRVEVNWIAPLQLSVTLALARLCARQPPRSGSSSNSPWPNAALLLAAQAVLVTAIAAAPALQRVLAPQRALPAALDGWARMQGWREAFAALAPALPNDAGLTVVGASRTVMAHAAYHWRGLALRRAAWAPVQPPGSHYELSCPWRAGDDDGPLLVLSEGPPPAELVAAMGGLVLLARADVRVAADRHDELQLLRALSPPPRQQGLAPLRCR